MNFTTASPSARRPPERELHCTRQQHYQTTIAQMTIARTASNIGLLRATRSAEVR
jgi:hypothetical protein